MGQRTTPPVHEFEESQQNIEPTSIDSNQTDAPEQHEHEYLQLSFNQSINQTNDQPDADIQPVQPFESPILLSRTDSSTALLPGSFERLSQNADDEQKSLAYPNYQSTEQVDKTVTDSFDISLNSSANEDQEFMLREHREADIKLEDQLIDYYPDLYSDQIEPEIKFEDDEADGFPEDYEGKYPFRWRKFAKFLGPSALMSVAYLDPGNLESDLQAGSRTGYQLLWLLLCATLIGYFMQCLALRLGVATGLHLAQHCRASFTRRRRIMVWLCMEAAVIGSDIQEILGSALAFQLLFGLPIWAGVLITAADTFTFLFLHVFGIRKLEAFFAALISVMFVCFFIEFGMVQPDADTVFRGFVPGLESYAVLQAVGLLGSIIMPHNLFLHSALVQSRAINRTKKNRIAEGIQYYSVEAALAIGVSFLINFAVVCVFAKGFWSEECAKQGLALVDGVCSDEVGFTNAGDALQGLLGGAAKIVWAIGLLASGQASTMTGVQTGQFIMSGFLDLRMKPWQRIILTRSIAMGPAVIVALASRGDHTALDVTTQFINVAMSILLPFSVLPLLHFTSNPTIMGSFVNTRSASIFGWTFSACAICINLYLVVQLLHEANLDDGAWVGVSFLFIGYFCLVMWLLEDELMWLYGKAKQIYMRYNQSLQPISTRSSSMDEHDEPHMNHISDETEMTKVRQSVVH